MVQLINLLPAEISYEQNSGRQYTALPIFDRSYGNLEMSIFYLPISAVSAIRETFDRTGRILDNFIVFRDIGAEVVKIKGRRQVSRFIVEDVTHIKMRSLIAKVFLDYFGKARNS